MHSYTYIVLRYVHDTTSAEFVNVGVALYAPDVSYLGARCRHTYGRINKLFPGVKAEHFKALMRHVESKFVQLGERLRSQLPLRGKQDFSDIVREILPNDDSSLRWSIEGSGRTPAPAKALESLYQRMVMKYEERGGRERRDEEEVWRHFRRSLEARQLLRFVEPRVVAVQDDALEFQHTLQNGVLHCLEPVSFDLANADSIKDKAHRWLGRISSVQDSAAPFRMYFLVGEPKDRSLTSAYANALRILEKVPVQKMIVPESQAEMLGQFLSNEMARHPSHADERETAQS
jgi:hypothetical protein